LNEQRLRVYQLPIILLVSELNWHVHDVVSPLRIVWVVFEVLKVFQNSKLNNYFVPSWNSQFNFNDAFTAALIFPKVVGIGFVLDFWYLTD